MDEVRFVVPGEPTGKGRPQTKVMYNPNGFKDKKTGKVRNTMVNNVTPKKTVIYENLVKCIYHEQCQDFRFPDGAMLDMRILAYYGIPKSKSKKIKEQMAKGLLRPIKKPDMDNVVTLKHTAVIKYHRTASMRVKNVPRLFCIESLLTGLRGSLKSRIW